MAEKIELLSFTARGAALAESLSAALDGHWTDGRGEGFSLRAWTETRFARADALLFIGAAGIAVRAIAPCVKSKAEDPAVLCVDELGRFVIPLLSGHLGGANALARRVAALCGGTAVITTATDINGAFAVDLWAKRQGLSLPEPEKIKTVSAAVLRGETVTVSCPWPIAGQPPEGVRQGEGGAVTVDYRPGEGTALRLIPRCLSLGIGCRKGIEPERLEAAFAAFCEERAILPEAVCRAASVDLKRGEAGLLAFCASHGWPLTFYSAAELAALPGEFTPSAFVQSTVGVDNVCERAAVCAGGDLIEKKYAREGVTFALALSVPELDWSW